MSIIKEQERVIDSLHIHLYIYTRKLSESAYYLARREFISLSGQTLKLKVRLRM
jgi:hypothetical protein